MVSRWDSKALIPEILRTFLDADREFQSWSRSGGSDPARHISTSSLQRQHQGASVTCSTRYRLT
jgi:hypothetical protein